MAVWLFLFCLCFSLVRLLSLTSPSLCVSVSVAAEWRTCFSSTLHLPAILPWSLHRFSGRLFRPLQPLCSSTPAPGNPGCLPVCQSASLVISPTLPPERTIFNKPFASWSFVSKCPTKESGGNWSLLYFAEVTALCLHASVPLAWEVSWQALCHSFRCSLALALPAIILYALRLLFLKVKKNK